MNKFLLPIFSLLLLLSANTNAQHALGLYHLQNVPQQSYVNPAFTPSAKFHIGIPALSSIHLGYANGGFAYSDAIKKNNDDSLYLDVDYLIANWKDNASIQTKFHTDLFNIGFRITRNYFTISATEKVEFDITLPRDLIDLAWNGNADFLGKSANVGINTNMIHYREYGITWMRELNSKLKGGIKVKYLYGMENIHTEKSDVSIYTDEDDFSLSATSDVLIHTSGLGDDSFKNIDITDYLIGKGNQGFATDLGVSYKVNSKWLLNFSVIDIGYITWKNDNSSYSISDENSSFTFSGIDIDEYLNGDNTIDELTNDLLDSLSDSFVIDTVNQNYTSLLNPKVYVGVNYQLNPIFSANLLGQIEQVGKNYKPAGSLAINAKVSTVLTATAAWSYFNKQLNNFGAGFAVQMGPVQWHLTSDNLLSVFKPTEAHSVSIRTGINILIGRPKKDRDFDGISNKEDTCPKDYGLAEFGGCPDTDDDGVQDSEDACPDEAGTKEFHGCPAPNTANITNQ